MQLLRMSFCSQVLRSREALAGLCGGLRAGVAVGGTAAVALGPVGESPAGLAA